jgi:CheY-like chemotaxis protein
MPRDVVDRANGAAIDASPQRSLVLIADSHDDSRGMLAILLKAAGYDTAECDGGGAAISSARELRPDVVLLSTNSWGDSLGIVSALQGGDGASRSRVVVITGHADPAFRQRALMAGCEACLLKPVDVDELIRELSRLTDRPPVFSAPSRLARNSSADARKVVEECCNSIDSAKAALEQARAVSARASKQIERANRFLARVGHRGLINDVV